MAMRWKLDCTPETGSYTLSMMKSPRAQQVKVRPTIYAAFHKLETIYDGVWRD